MPTTAPDAPTAPDRPTPAARDPRPARAPRPHRSRTARRAAAALAVLLVAGAPVAACAPGAGLLPGRAAAPATDPRLRDDRVDPFDDTHPAIAGLDPVLRVALQSAARDAHARGVDLWVTSGLRTVEQQRELLDDAVARYGSLEEARRFVAPPDTSSHVTGDAVDIGPTDGADWVLRHGADYGLCQTYANEMWHFERVTEPGGTCPEPRADATQ